jgi:hypothetical protein
MAPVAFKACCSWDPIVVQCPLITRCAVRSVLVITNTQRDASLRAYLSLWASLPRYLRIHPHR